MRRAEGRTDQEALLAVTPGEPAGIGPEILLKFCRDHPEFRVLAVADPDLLDQAAVRCSSSAAVSRMAESSSRSAVASSMAPTARRVSMWSSRTTTFQGPCCPRPTPS